MGASARLKLRQQSGTAGFPRAGRWSVLDNRLWLYHLDGLSDIVHMVPTIKILNLSNNEVRRGSQIKVGMRVGGLVVVIRVMTGGR